jgi:hypothetical protein
MEYLVSQDVLSAKLSEETVLLDMRTKNYFQLNATAARLWDSLERGRTVKEMVEELEELYAAPAEQVELETRRLLAGLADRNLILERE